MRIGYLYLPIQVRSIVDGMSRGTRESPTVFSANKRLLSMDFVVASLDSSVIDGKSGRFVFTNGRMTPRLSRRTSYSSLALKRHGTKSHPYISQRSYPVSKRQSPKSIFKPRNNKPPLLWLTDRKNKSGGTMNLNLGKKKSVEFLFRLL